MYAVVRRMPSISLRSCRVAFSGLENAPSYKFSTAPEIFEWMNWMNCRKTIPWLVRGTSFSYEYPLSPFLQHHPSPPTNTEFVHISIIWIVSREYSVILISIASLFVCLPIHLLWKIVAIDYLTGQHYHRSSPDVSRNRSPREFSSLLNLPDIYGICAWNNKYLSDLK